MTNVDFMAGVAEGINEDARHFVREKLPWRLEGNCRATGAPSHEWWLTTATQLAQAGFHAGHAAARAADTCPRNEVEVRFYVVELEVLASIINDQARECMGRGEVDQAMKLWRDAHRLGRIQGYDGVHDPLDGVSAVEDGEDTEDKDTDA